MDMKTENLAVYISKILRTVKKDGDRALVRYNAKFDRVKTPISQLKVSDESIKNSAKDVPSSLKSAIQKAASNIEKFHKVELKNITISWKIKDGSAAVGQIT